MASTTATKFSVNYLLNSNDVPISLVPATTTRRYPIPATGGTRKPRPRRFVCERCDFGFYTNADLQKHIVSVHQKLKPYGCHVCGKRFGEKSNATKHYRSVHERQRNAQCGQCNATFAFKDGLARHVRLVHDGVRKFRCKVPGCTSDAFKQAAHLKKHYSAVHKIENSPRH